MSEPLSRVSQFAMDQFYQNFKSDTDFFDLPDFVFHCGATVTDYYKQEWEKLRVENRQEKQDEIISFSIGALSEQDITIDFKDGVLSAKIEKPYMTFPYDQWEVGLQMIIPKKGDDGIFKRSSLSEIWKFKHLVGDNKIYWYPTSKTKIRFFKKNNCSVKEATLFYVPIVNDDMLVPDGIIRWVVDNTVMTMKQIKDGTIVKKSLDGNENVVLQTEMNKEAIK